MPDLVEREVAGRPALIALPPGTAIQLVDEKQKDSDAPSCDGFYSKAGDHGK
jgi:hypothetical protein